jgi:hypothetical protein
MDIKKKGSLLSLHSLRTLASRVFYGGTSSVCFTVRRHPLERLDVVVRDVVFVGVWTWLRRFRVSAEWAYGFRHLVLR